MTPAAVPVSVPEDTTYPLDDRLRATLAEAREQGDQAAEDAAALALAIRGHKHFRALVLRMRQIPILPTARGLARTEKTALLGQPEKGTDLGRAHALARLIVADLAVPDSEAKAAADLALVLAEECGQPLSKARRRAQVTT